jgi:hypothetical protein
MWNDRTPAGNIPYTQAGVSCIVRQESGKFKVQFFVGSSVVKIPACVYLKTDKTVLQDRLNQWIREFENQ